MTNPDLDWVMNLYGLFARGGDDETMFYATILGDPWSKSRPRFTRRTGKTYQPRDDLEAEQRLAWRLRAAGAREFPGNVMLACRFYRSNLQRIDADNLLKHVCDSANGILWADDSQVTLVVGEVHRDPEQPRTVVMAANHASSLPRGADLRLTCQQCGEHFIPGVTNRDRLRQKYCSQKCLSESRRVAEMPRFCMQCGQAYKPWSSRQKTCSRTCGAQWRKKTKPKTRNLSNCATCGKQLAHNRGGRCRDCWRANPRGVA